ncbi:MAG TPA: hypothetical protein VF532_19690, partial [Candidatus Angelobacter sp.]
MPDNQSYTFSKTEKLAVVVGLGLALIGIGQNMSGLGSPLFGLVLLVMGMGILFLCLLSLPTISRNVPGMLRLLLFVIIYCGFLGWLIPSTDAYLLSKLQREIPIIVQHVPAPEIAVTPSVRPSKPIFVQVPSQPLQPVVTPKANMVFSFYVDDPDEFPLRKISVPVEGVAVKVGVTFKATGEVPAKNGVIWIRICTLCMFGREPEGFLTPDINKPKDRSKHFDIMYPNVVMQKIDL